MVCPEAVWFVAHYNPMAGAYGIRYGLAWPVFLFCFVLFCHHDTWLNQGQLVDSLVCRVHGKKMPSPFHMVCTSSSHSHSTHSEHQALSRTSWTGCYSHMLHTLPPIWMMLSSILTPGQSICSEWHSPGVPGAGGAQGQHEEVCDWTEGATVYGVPLGGQAGASIGGENRSDRILPAPQHQKRV